MDLVLNILNESGYIVDNEKAQIIDNNKNEVGIISLDGDLVTYSFSDGRKLVFDKENNQITIHISNELDILFKMINSSNSNNVDITLNMKLSNGTLCSLEHYLRQTELCTDYEVGFSHKNLEDNKNIIFSKYSKNPSVILYSYENGFLDYTGILDPNSYNAQGLLQTVLYSYLKPLIIDSGLIENNDIIEINNIMEKGTNIIDKSINELVNYFLTYDFSENRKIPCGIIQLLSPQSDEQQPKVKKLNPNTKKDD